MAVLMSTICYASLNTYAYGPPQYKEGILLSDDEDNAQQPCIAAAVPCVLSSSKKTMFPSKAVGVFRCVPKRDHPGLSINDYLSFPTTPRFFFCLVEFANTDASVRVFRVNYKNYIYSLEPTEFELIPQFPLDEEPGDTGGSKPLTQLFKSRLEEIKSCNAQLLCQMTKSHDASGDSH